MSDFELPAGEDTSGADDILAYVHGRFRRRRRTQIAALGSAALVIVAVAAAASLADPQPAKVRITNPSSSVPNNATTDAPTSSTTFPGSTTTTTTGDAASTTTAPKTGTPMIDTPLTATTRACETRPADPSCSSTVTGTIRNAAGQPVSNWYAIFESSAGILMGPTDGAGHYRLDNVPAGSYILYAKPMNVDDGPMLDYGATRFFACCHHEGAPNISVRAHTTQTFDFRLPAYGRVPVRVLDTNGDPMAGMTVQATGTPGTGSPSWTMRTGADGTVVFDWLSPGTYDFTASNNKIFGTYRDADGNPIHVTIATNKTTPQITIRADTPR